MKLDQRLPRHEIVELGFCQLLLTSFKQLYEINRQKLGLAELSEEPEIITYPDNSIALSWWPHQIYRVE